MTYTFDSRGASKERHWDDPDKFITQGCRPWQRQDAEGSGIGGGAEWKGANVHCHAGR